MNLIFGGAYQAKKTAAFSITGLDSTFLTDGETCSPEDILTAKIIDHFHLLVKRGLAENRDLYELCTRMIRVNPEVTVICNELGCGIVPMEPFDRKWREETGRLCCVLAEHSEAVYRVYAGIAVRIK